MDDKPEDLARLGRELADLAADNRQGRDPAIAGELGAALAALRDAGIREMALREGEMAPEFDLPDATGHWINLADLLRNGAAVVAFYRGAWCPYCNVTLQALERMRRQLHRAGVRLAAISPQPRDMALAMGDRQLLGFDLLHDAGNRVARLYGLLYELPPSWITFYRARGIDIARINGNGRWELPLAATYLIGRDGTAAYASVEIDPARRFDPAALMAAVERIGVTT